MNRSEQIWAYRKAAIAGADTTTLTELRNAIAIANDRLSLMVARRMQQRCNLPLEDLAQLSRLGMLKAIPKFDPTKGVAFSSFVVPYCEGAIKHHLRDRKGTVKVPRRWQEKSDEARAIQQKLIKQGRSLIALDEIATVGMKLDAEQWQTIAHATQHKPCASLDDAIGIAAPESLTLEEREEREATQDALIAALSRLPQTARQCVIEKYWGNLPDAIIARRHSMTPAQLQTLFAQTLQDLRSAAPC